MLIKTKILSLRELLFVAALPALLLGCGQIKKGTPGVLNDAVPAGNVISQDSFVGVNGKEVSGVAAVYQLDTGSFLIRLEGLKAPSESGLQIFADIDGERTFVASLRATSGTMNYPMSLTGTHTFTSVRIVKPTTSPPLDYGIASFGG